jgi:hypothetical protein
MYRIVRALSAAPGVISRLLVFNLGVVTSATALADPIVTWEKDKLSGFSLTFSGTLIGGPSAAGTESGTFVSPSGRWKVEYLGADYFQWEEEAFVEEEGPPVEGRFTGYKSFSFFSAPYTDYVYSLPYASGEGFEVFPDGPDYHVYEGYRIQIHSGDFTDLTTWNYTVRIWLETPKHLVPDGGATMAMIVLVATGYVLVRKSRRQWAR